MTFLNPWSAILAAAVAVPLLLLLYFLKLRRQTLRMASTLLWRSATVDLQANVPFQRLRWSLLLLTSIAVMVAACGGANSDPASTMNAYVTAYNSGDLDEIMVFFAEESVVTGHPCPSHDPSRTERSPCSSTSPVTGGISSHRSSHPYRQCLDFARDRTENAVGQLAVTSKLSRMSMSCDTSLSLRQPE